MFLLFFECEHVTPGAPHSPTAAAAVVPLRISWAISSFLDLNLQIALLHVAVGFPCSFARDNVPLCAGTLL